MTNEQIFFISPVTDRYMMPKPKFNIYTAVGIKATRKMSEKEMVKHIIKTVTKCLHLSINEISAYSSVPKLVYARQLCMYFLSTKTTLTHRQIGYIFNGRARSTVTTSLHTIKAVMSVDLQVQADIMQIGQLI